MKIVNDIDKGFNINITILDSSFLQNQGFFVFTELSPRPIQSLSHNVGVLSASPLLETSLQD
jgi:hypothetical protein